MTMDRICTIRITTPGDPGAYVQGEYPSAAEDLVVDFHRWCSRRDSPTATKVEEQGGQAYYRYVYARRDFTVPWFAELVEADIENVLLIESGDAYSVDNIIEPEGTRRKELIIQARTSI